MAESPSLVKPFQPPSYEYGSLDEAFPSVDPGIRPFGYRILVQIRSPKKTTAGGIALPADVQETELWNTQVGKVVGMGPVAFKNRDSMEPWPEGAWCEVGAYVRIPKYGGDRWYVPLPDNPQEKALFSFFKDTDLIGQVLCNPLDVIAFL